MPPVLPKIAEPLRSLTSSGIHSLRECCPDQRGVVRSAVRRRKGPDSVRTGEYIACVFENDLVQLDPVGTLAAADANEHVSGAPLRVPRRRSSIDAISSVMCWPRWSARL